MSTEIRPKNDKTLSKATALLFIGVTFVVAAPFLFTRRHFWDILNINWIALDFHDTGQIGDTIGGITAPIVNLIGAVLVFYALKAQVQANELVQKQIDSQKQDEIIRRKTQYINKKINIVRNDIKEFTLTYIEKSGKQPEINKKKYDYVGSKAVNRLVGLLKQLPEHHNTNIMEKFPALTELFLLLQTTDALLDDIDEENILKEDKFFFKSILGYHFKSKIKPAFTGNENFRTRNLEPCTICGERHEKIPDKIDSKIS